MVTTSPQELLKIAYDQLGYNEGPLYEGGNEPGQFSKDDWIEKGEWLTLTKEVDAEKIFFVKNNPVAVFAKSDVNEPEALRQLFNKIWCMSRPRLLFLAYPGELAVYDLAREPVRKEEWEKVTPLEVVTSSKEVASKLKAFRRELLETGRLFEDKKYEDRFGNLKNRADKALINDLKEVRKELIKKGLDGDKIKYAHALIGRSIFIRYLEDRGILIPEDFYEIALNNKKWKEILKNDTPRSGVNLSEEDSLYARVLSDKNFTFALFEKLAEDFNGDMFPDIEQEKKVITSEHIEIIQDLLFGDVGKQKKLFFYAYKFKIVPIELISSIYEEFYHPGVNKEKSKKTTKKSSEGAYYTPPALVEFLVNQVLTPERLKTKPRILDPACGSGIFLVEAFRRIVRQKRLELGKNLNFQNLQVILREQIAGIEINPEAVRIAAFSLYLAMLHYLDPPSIREQIYKRGNHLPNLVFDEDDQKEKSYNTLLVKSAFDSDYIENNPVLAKTFASNCADIVIGNPPWGSPKGEGEEAKKANNIAVNWCQERELPVGKGERSQLFIWRALNLSKPNGVIGLLVHFNTFLMHHGNSEEFREKWLRKSDLRSVFNLSHVRDVFFKGAIAPFAGVIFKNCNKKKNQSIEYWSAKHSKVIEQSQSVVLNKSDLKYIRKDQPLHKHQLWKIYWWGNHQDEYFLTSLKRYKSLLELSPDGYHGRGFEVSDGKYPSDWLLDYKELPTSDIKRYGPLNLHNLKEIPNKVHDRGIQNVYSGMRILVNRGIRQKGGTNGQIVACYAKDAFAFRNSIYGIKFTSEKEWMYKCLLGILWSSLAKYYLLLTTYDFGVWHDEIRLKDELMQLPICFPTSEPLKNQIINIVDKLQSSALYKTPNIFQTNKNQNILSRKEVTKLEKQLDEAVFELYGLSDAEIDLIQDMCEGVLPYYYSPDKSSAGKPVLAKQLLKPYGTIESLPQKTDFSEYIKVFIQSWIPYLDEGTEFGWQVYQPEQTDSMIAVVFSVQKKGRKVSEHSMGDIKCWDDVLIQLEENLTQPFHSSRIYLEGMVRAVTDDFIMIIKRNERRLWTRSIAREDAEATLVQAMNRENMRERIRR